MNPEEVVLATQAGRGARESTQRRLARHWLGLAVAVLPPRWRERYAEEWHTEMDELVGHNRLRYAAHQLVRAWALRRALRGRSPARDPGQDTEDVTGGAATLGRLGAAVLAGFAADFRALLLGGLATVVFATAVLVVVLALVAVLAGTGGGPRSVPVGSARRARGHRHERRTARPG